VIALQHAAQARAAYCASLHRLEFQASSCATGLDGHVVLDVLGVVDPTGVSDAINAGWYLSEGDHLNAGISAAAIIPYVGDLGKLAKYGIKGIDGLTTGLRGVDDVVVGGTRSGDALPIGAACSFAALTLVRTTEGEVPISELDVGDEVLATDEASGTIASYPVTAVWSHDDPVTGTIEIDGERIHVTPDHPFRTIDRGWQVAGDLRPGDKVVSLTGGPGAVGEVRWDRGPGRMWNLTVATAHTYTVGEGTWLVHNACSPYQVGTYDELKRASEVGDDLAIHHAPQDAVAAQILPGHTRGGGPSIALPTAEHIRLPTLPSSAEITPRDLLALDLRNLRKYTNAPNTALFELLRLAKRTYPAIYG
jgi:hypothetical protein